MPPHTTAGLDPHPASPQAAGLTQANRWCVAPCTPHCRPGSKSSIPTGYRLAPIGGRGCRGVNCQGHGVRGARGRAECACKGDGRGATRGAARGSPLLRPAYRHRAVSGRRRVQPATVSRAPPPAGWVQSGGKDHRLDRRRRRRFVNRGAGTIITIIRDNKTEKADTYASHCPYIP